MLYTLNASILFYKIRNLSIFVITDFKKYSLFITQVSFLSLSITNFGRSLVFANEEKTR